MLASGITGITLRDVRLGQIAIGLLLLQPLVGYVLTIVGLMPAAVGIVPFNPLPLAVLALSLGLLIYLRLHVGRGWLFRLFRIGFLNGPTSGSSSSVSWVSFSGFC